MVRAVILSLHAVCLLGNSVQCHLIAGLFGYGLKLYYRTIPCMLNGVSICLITVRTALYQLSPVTLVTPVIVNTDVLVIFRLLKATKLLQARVVYCLSKFKP